MVRTFLAILLILFASILFSQNLTKDSLHELKPIACDCKKAIKLNIGWNSEYGPTIATKGYGDVQEIPLKEKFSKYYFETEHNSAWYLLKMNVEGELVFDVVPVTPTNDYDFLLFNYVDTNFCSNFLARKLIPVRSNISRVNSEDNGKTGLSPLAKVEYASRGRGFAYSKSMHVKKGEQCMLVLDNVYDNGQGHTITFHILKDFNFSGKTLGDDSMPVSATVSVVQKNGTVIAKTISDKTTGEYQLIAPLEIAEKYIISSYTDNSFFDIKTFYATAKNSDTIIYKPTVIPKLKEDKAFKLKNLLFYGNSPELLPESFVTLDALFAILALHNKMTIRIEGHVNAPGVDLYVSYQRLSEARAQTVYNYLVNKGVEKGRLSTIGFGNKYPVFANPEDDTQGQQNRRVEIRIISMGK